MKQARILLAGAMLAGMTLSQSGANAAAIVAYPGNQAAPYHPTAIQTGGTLNFIQLDPLAAHNVAASKTDNKPRSWCGVGKPFPANACPVFYSGNPVGAGTTDTVDGVPALSAGSYDFVCVLHAGQGQKGTLTVL